MVAKAAGDNEALRSCEQPLHEILRTNSKTQRSGGWGSRSTTLTESEAVQGNLRLGLVLVKNNTGAIPDITAPFENRVEARQSKLPTDQDVAKAISNRFSEVKVDNIVLGSLGI